MLYDIHRIAARSDIGDKRKCQRPDRQCDVTRSAGESEPNAAETRVGGVEHQRPRDDPRSTAKQQPEHPRRCAWHEILNHPVHTDCCSRDQTASEDRNRVPVIFEVGAGDPGVAVEITALSNLGPWRPQAYADEGEQQVDDPDPKIVAGPARESRIGNGTARLPPGCRAARRRLRRPVEPPASQVSERQPHPDRRWTGPYRDGEGVRYSSNALTARSILFFRRGGVNCSVSRVTVHGS